MMRIWVSKPSSSSTSSTQSSSHLSSDSFLSDLPQRFRLRYRNRFVSPRPAKEKAIDLNEYMNTSDGEDINPECYLYEELHVTPVGQENQSMKDKRNKQKVWKGKGREGEEDADVTKRKRREENEFFKTGRDFIHTHRHVEFRKPTKKKQEQVQLQDQLQSLITIKYMPISCSVAPLLTPSTSNPLPSSSPSSSTKPRKRRWSAPLHFVTLPLLGRNSTGSEPDPPTTRRPTPSVTLSFDLVSALSDFLGPDFAVSKLGFIPDDDRCLAVCKKLGIATPLLAVVPSCGSSSSWSHSYVFLCQTSDGDMWGYSMVEGLWKFGDNEQKLDWRGLGKFVTRSLRGKGIVRGWGM